jgi:hypothetical protein
MFYKSSNTCRNGPASAINRLSCTWNWRFKWIAFFRRGKKTIHARPKKGVHLFNEITDLMIDYANIAAKTMPKGLKTFAMPIEA